MNQIVGASLKEAIQMATLNPAKVLGIDDRVGSLEQGKLANLVVLDENMNVYTTIVKGKIVFKKQ
jgi:N-acetylglucosamine-6-phosphate deacetylase